MLQNKNTALLVMDIQEITVKMLGETENLIISLKNAIQKARTNNIPVIYVAVGFRKGYPEVSIDNKGFTYLKNNSPLSFDSEENTKIYSEIAPEDGEIVILKKRVSAFTGSDLEVVLRSFEIKHLVLTGIATSGVVLSTIREASDKDYKLTVLADCCADRDEEVHSVLLNKIFPRQAEVINVENWSI